MPSAGRVRPLFLSAAALPATDDPRTGAVIEATRVMVEKGCGAR